MDTMLRDEVTTLQQDLHLIQLAVEALQEKLNKLIGRFQERANYGDRSLKRLVDLEGIWEGANFSYEEIKAAEYKVPEDLL